MIALEERPTEGSATRIVLAGRLDSAGVEQIEPDLAAALGRGAPALLFDLGAITFVGSMGIRLLIASGRALQRQGRQLVLFGVQPQVAEVFDTMTLGDLIPITATEAEALEQLGR